MVLSAPVAHNDAGRVVYHQNKRLPILVRQSPLSAEGHSRNSIIYRVSTVYLPYIYRVCTVVGSTGA